MNYIITGSDEYLVSQEVKQIIKEFLPHDEGALNQVFYDGMIANWQGIVEDAGTFSFFGDKKVIVAENCWFLTTREALSENEENQLLQYLQNPNPATVLILTVGDKTDNRKTLVKTLKKLCKSIEIEPLSKEDFAALVRKNLKDNNIVMPYEAVEELLSRLPVEVRNWQSELDKLSLYPGSIDRKVISELISRSINDEAYDLSNAVLSGKLDESLVILNGLLVKSQKPIGLVALLAANFRFIYQVKVWAEKGYNQAEIAEEFAVHPYRVKKSLETARRTSADQLLEILAGFAELDFKLKNAICDEQLELELLIIDILGRKHAVAQATV